MITDPWFIALAIPSVIMIGLSKGGFAGAGAIALPLMSIVAPPLMVAAVLLPVLLALDVVAIRLYRDSYDRTTLLYTLPASLVGVAVAWVVAAQIEPAYFKILIGAIGIVFTLSIWIRPKVTEPRAQSLARGSFWGVITGFTSFVTLTGGPPFQIYVLPLRLPHRIYAGTFVIFMAINNVVKIGPFVTLGQFDTSTLWTSLALLPLAFCATLAGAKLIKHVSSASFYRVIHILMFVVSVKLITDGFTSILAG
ncbi:MAG: sulfite exporter TauE/SafE family protein [Rhizobiales bacterium]|nr:sulfite exporter TauE/SafE family protein [Hyphomicrobiales bacterium]